MTRYEFATHAGVFRIAVTANGRWQAMFEDEGLGSYTTPQQALDDLVGGHTFWPSCGDPSRFGLPEELADWSFIRR